MASEDMGSKGSRVRRPARELGVCCCFMKWIFSVQTQFLSFLSPTSVSILTRSSASEIKSQQHWLKQDKGAFLSYVNYAQRLAGGIIVSIDQDS
jgi:hypothetical protein